MTKQRNFDSDSQQKSHKVSAKVEEVECPKYVLFRMNLDKSMRWVTGVISTLLAAPVAMGAGLLVNSDLRGRNVSDVGVPMYEHAGIALAGGLVINVLVMIFLLVLIHDFVRSFSITTFGVVWMLVWVFVYLIAATF